MLLFVSINVGILLPCGRPYRKWITSQQFRMRAKCVYFSHLGVICNSIGDDFGEFIIFISGFESKVKAIKYAITTCDTSSGKVKRPNVTLKGNCRGRLRMGEQNCYNSWVFRKYLIHMDPQNFVNIGFRRSEYYKMQINWRMVSMIKPSGGILNYWQFESMFNIKSLYIYVLLCNSHQLCARPYCSPIINR